MPKFAYNNIKNASIDHTLFELNCKFLPQVLFEDDINSYSKSCSTHKLVDKLRKLIVIFCQNSVHTQKLYKRAYDKWVKNCSYALSEKIWLNRKYIKTKQNQKPKNKFFGLSQVLYTVEKQVYKLELPTK